MGVRVRIYINQVIFPSVPPEITVKPFHGKLARAILNAREVESGKWVIDAEFTIPNVNYRKVKKELREWAEMLVDEGLIYSALAVLDEFSRLLNHRYEVTSEWSSWTVWADEKTYESKLRVTVNP